ncbi:MAG: hypothetical protein Q9186_007524 [Xanthomendoza sp. 1 TL-2023]
MAEQLLQQAQDLLEGQIVRLASQLFDPPNLSNEGLQDFEGQRLTELFSTIILAITGFLAFALGFTQNNIWITLWVGLGGTALTFFLVVPPWPIFNENPENWLRANSGISGAGIEVDGKKIN